MKPIVIYPKQLKEDQIVLTKKEFEKYLKDAYDSGYEDGRKVYWAPYYYPTTTTPHITWTNDKSNDWDWTKVTCNDNQNTVTYYNDNYNTITTTTARKGE